MRAAPVLLAALLAALPPTLCQVSSTALLVRYDFSSGDAEGWSGTVGGGAAPGAPADAVGTGAGTLQILPPPLQATQPAFVDSPLMAVAYTDAAYAVLRLRVAGGGGASAGLAALALRDAPPPLPPGDAAAPPYNYSWEGARTRTFATLGDGAWHTYAVPLHASGRRAPLPTPSDASLLLHQVRLYPALAPGSGSGGGGIGSLAPLLQGGAELDYLRIALAPTLLRVEGCSPLLLYEAAAPANASQPAPAWPPQLRAVPYAPTPPRQPPHRATRRAPHALNRHYATPSDALRDARASADARLPWASTYNCARGGGDRVTLTGTHFGVAPPRITVNGLPCTDVRLEAVESRASCTVPALGEGGGGARGAPGRGAPVAVTIANGDMPQLYDSKPLLRYAAPPPRPGAPPTVTNVASRSLAVAWPPPPPEARWAALTITGYIVSWRGAVVDDASVPSSSSGGGGEEEEESGSGGSVGRVSSAGLQGDLPAARAPSQGAGSRGVGQVSVGSAQLPGGGGGGAAGAVLWGPWGALPLGGEAVVDNRTHVTLRGLAPGVRYQFRVAAVSEDVRGAWGRGGGAGGWGGSAPVSGDAYGVRGGSSSGRSSARTLTPGALLSAFSPPSPDVRTLLYDFYFAAFDANATLDWGPVHRGSSLNSGGWAGGEGHYGLTLVGAAHVGNCNASTVCCDGYGGGGGGAFLDAAREALAAEEARGINSGSPAVGRGAEDARSAAAHAAHPPTTFLWSAGEAALGWRGLGGSGSGSGSGADSSSNPWAAARPPQPLNTGTLPAFYRPSSPACDAPGGAGGAPAAAADAPALRPGSLCLRHGRLHSADSLLSRRLHTPIAPAPLGAWATQGAPGEASGPRWAAGGVYDEYDEAGRLKLVPESVLWDLGNASAAGGGAVDEAVAALERARRGGYAVGVGVAWAGQWVAGQGLDARVAPGEAALGPLDGVTGAQGPAPPYPYTPTRAGTDPTPPGSGAWGLPGNLPGSAPAPPLPPLLPPPRALAGTAADPEVPGHPRSVPPRAPPLPPPVFHDRLGRRLLAWPADPTASCAAVCIGAAEAAAGGVAVNLGELRGEDAAGGLVLPGYTYGYESILGAVEAGEGGEGGGGSGGANASEHHGEAPTTTARVTGRLSAIDAALPPTNLQPPAAQRSGYSWAQAPRSGDSASGPLQPRPATSFPTPTRVLPSAAAPALARNATAPCGPALRLTPAAASATGAAWYARAVDVREGFDSAFLFRAANPSLHHCRTHSDVATRCSGGGGAGFALVLQTAHPAALGNGSAGLGYSGLAPALAVEFDSWGDGALGDPGAGGHVSVHSRGALAGASANHSFSLGSAAPAGGLAEGLHAARLRYVPGRLRREPGLAAARFWAASPHATSLMAGAGARGGWAGVLEVWLDAEEEGAGGEPLLAVPCDLEQLLGLGATGGRAWVGFTAATGDDLWQQHDILAWAWTSLRLVEE